MCDVRCAMWGVRGLHCTLDIAHWTLNKGVEASPIGVGVKVWGLGERVMIFVTCRTSATFREGSSAPQRPVMRTRWGRRLVRSCWADCRARDWPMPVIWRRVYWLEYWEGERVLSRKRRMMGMASGATAVKMTVVGGMGAMVTWFDCGDDCD